MRRGLLSALISALLACSDGGADGDDGVDIAVWQLVELFRIGSIDAQGAERFGDFIALEADSTGTLFVADNQSSEIRVFGGDGEHLRTFGRRGSGPGEFLDLIGLTRDPAGRLWAADFGNRRLVALDSLGGETESRTLMGFRSEPWWGRIDDQGTVHNVILLFLPPTPRLAFVRDDSPEDTLYLPPYSVTQREVVTADGQQRLINVPHGDRPRWTLDGDGHLWFGTTDRYEIHRLAYDGDTMSTITGPARRVELTEEERARAIAGIRATVGESAAVDPSWVPAVRAAFESVSADDRRRVWVGSPRAGGRNGFEIFENDGRLIARANLPAEILPSSAPLIRGNRMYVIVRGELDVSYVVAFRIDVAPLAGS